MNSETPWLVDNIRGGPCGVDFGIVDEQILSSRSPLRLAVVRDGIAMVARKLCMLDSGDGMKIRTRKSVGTLSSEATQRPIKAQGNYAVTYLPAAR